MAKAKKQETKSEAAADKPASKKVSAAKADTAAANDAPATKKRPTKTATPTAGTSASAGKKSAKSDKPAAAPQAPLIDTGLAAQAAAAMVANRGAAAAAQPGGQPQQESSAFKNLKESLSKPSMGGLGGILGPAGGQKKFNQGFGGPKQSGPGGGRNQTYGADVNRTGVPRRTSG